MLVHVRKKLIFIFWKTASTIVIKFCGFIVHSNLTNMTLSAIPGKSFKIIIFFNFLPIAYLSPTLVTKSTDWSCSNSILRVPLPISPARFFFFFDLPLKLRVVYLRNKQTDSVTNMEFYKHVQYCFSCYVIKSAGEAANKVLLFVIWNPLLIEINISQIRTLDIKREKVCTVCPYLLFIFLFWCFNRWYLHIYHPLQYFTILISVQVMLLS